MSNTKTVFVTLTPRSLFFFGGEQGDTADYYLKGSFMPQQTAMFGFVRHQVLLQNRLMDDNKIINDEDAAKWIGNKSFEYNNTDQTFGKVKSISPCYLVKSENGTIEKYLPFYQPYCNTLQILDGNFFFPDFNPKEHYPDKWVSLLHKEKSVANIDAEKWVYKEVVKPGVDKNYYGETERGDDAYYKQVWLQMQKGFAFGFYLTVDTDVNFKDADVTFGKESSSFKMVVSEPVSVIDKFDDAAEPNALMLTSDAYVNEDVLSLVDFAVTDTIPFRNIVSPVSSKVDYSRIDKNRSESLNKKSKVRLLLLKRGSVFYAKNGNLNALKTAIDKHQNFKNIGYNHYHLPNIKY